MTQPGKAVKTIWVLDYHFQLLVVHFCSEFCCWMLQTSKDTVQLAGHNTCVNSLECVL